MSLNATDLVTLAPTATPSPMQALWNGIPMQFIVSTGIIITMAIALFALWAQKYYSNVGIKVHFAFHRNPDNTLTMRYYFHEIGPNPIRLYYKTPKEAAEIVQSVLEATFK